MSITDLTNTTWLFNSSISYMSRNTGYPLDFTDAGGNTWHKITIRTDGIRYAYDDSSYTTVNNNGSWVNNDYKTIHITGGTSVNVSAFITWLESNATQIANPVDLTGTSWRFNENLDIIDGQYNNTFYINFTDNENNSWTSINIDAGSEEDEGDPDDPDDDTYNEWQNLTFGNQNNNTLRLAYDGTWQYYVNEDWDYTGCIITINGGTDATNSDLADFLNANAVEYVAPSPSESINNTKLGTLNISKKKIGNLNVVKEVVNGITVYEV